MIKPPRAKPKILKIWPEIESYSPIMLYLPPVIKSGRVVIELTNCSSVDSSGLNILLMRLIRLGILSGIEHKESSLVEPRSPEIKKVLTDSGFFHYLNKIYRFDKSYKFTLFELYYQQHKPDMSNVTVIKTATGISQYSYPIYMFDFDIEDRRSKWNSFQSWILSILNNYEAYKIPKYELLSILKEIFKNSADHTDNMASFAMDIRQNVNVQRTAIEISFSFIDLGKGIFKNINDSLAELSRGSHGSITGIYHMAMQRGFSTKSLKTKINMGLGMDVITKGSRSIGMQLSVFDAQSRGILSSLEEVTHSEIRKHFFDAKYQVVFSYYGRLTCGAKS